LDTLRRPNRVGEHHFEGFWAGADEAFSVQFRHVVGRGRLVAIDRMASKLVSI
jgi:hypothetical protein